VTAPRRAPAPGPFAHRGAAVALVVLLVLAVLATGWVGLALRRDDDTPARDLDPAEIAGDQEEPAPAGGPIGGLPVPARGEVAALAGAGGLPEGWRAETGTWTRDDGGLRVEAAAPDGPSLAVTDVAALPWATVSVAGPPAGAGWGVVFGYAGPDDHFVVTVEGTTARLLRVEGGTETEIATGPVATGLEVLVALDVSGRNVAVHVGSTLLPSVQVPTEEAARVVGVRAAAGADATALRWASLGVRARPALEEPLVARGHEVTEMTPDEARRHLGP
jgi:hypothetical protein